MARNSPKKSANDVLGVITVDEAKEFVSECANLPNPLATWSDDSPRFERWLRIWQSFFTFQKEDDNGKWQTQHVPTAQLKLFVPKVRTALHRIWFERDTRQRDWYFYRLRDEYHHMIVRTENPEFLDLIDGSAIERIRKLERASRARRDNPIQRQRFFETMAGTDLFEEVPRICPFEAAVYWFQTNQKLMAYCDGPVCPARYFFRAEKGQKFCSPECADPARREAKLKWWNESPNSPKNRGKTEKSRRK